MNSFKQSKIIASWLVFAIALVVYFFSAERTGSLWDCGEFILGAYKLQVVHPPGAPLFMLVGRIFAWFGEIFSSDLSDIAFAVNLMSGVCTAFTAFFVARITMLFGKIGLVGRGGETDSTQNMALLFSGIAAGLTTAFCSSIWFSAVEGEVYAMSTMFTALTFWSAVKWYSLNDDLQNDRWLLLTFYLAGLSIGVHLLSLLTFPAIGLLFYFKKFKKHSLFWGLASLAAGAFVIPFIQKFIIVGIPSIWKSMELMTVNSFGLPIHSGFFLCFLIVAGIFYALLRYASKKNSYWLQFFTIASLLVTIGFSTIGIIVIRANADTPVNMNVPSDALRLLPYLNREQYGERPLLFGPHFDGKPEDYTREERYGRVGDQYEVVDEKLDYVYNPKDKIFFPRIGHTDDPRPKLHRQWYRNINGKEMKGKPRFGYNMQFFMHYQIGWMYWRYFMWNFSGKQNGKQGYNPWDKSNGHWISGIKFIDEMRVHEMDQLSDTMKNDPARNTYFMLPFLFGLLGMFFHMSKSKKEFMVLGVLFLMTGIGIILYSNQPPNEPRERDYVLVGSFFTYAIWVGMAVLFLFNQLRSKLSGLPAALIPGLIVLAAPIIMCVQNFDDHSRKNNYGSRDYASNFLNSVDENAIIFTYGDNDTYPLWYTQEVEEIRRDVRVVNLSLIAVDWYIEKLRKKVNDSAPLKLSLDTESYRGNNCNQVFFHNFNNPDDLNTPRNLLDELKFINNKEILKKTKGQAIISSRNVYIPVNKNKIKQSGLYDTPDSVMVDKINIRLPNRSFIMKDELAVLDVIASNMYDRPIYFAVTCKNSKLLKLNDYMQLEGLALKIIPERNASEEALAIYGSGTVAKDKLYDNVMNKWKWGNFDKVDTYLEDSYGAELQAMRITMMRAAEEFMATPEREKAADLARKYFEAFPHFNFPYDESVMPFIEILADTGNQDEAKVHLEILTNELTQRINFYNSLDESDFGGFRQDFRFAASTANQVLQVVKKLGDSSFEDKVKTLIGDFDLDRLRN